MKTIISAIALLFTSPLIQARFVDCDNSYISMNCGSPTGGGTFCQAPVHTFAFDNGQWSCRTNSQIIGACNNLARGNEEWSNVGKNTATKIGLTCTPVNGHQGTIKRAKMEVINDNGTWLWVTVEDNNGMAGYGCQVKPCAGNFCNYHCEVN